MTTSILILEGRAGPCLPVTEPQFSFSQMRLLLPRSDSGEGSAVRGCCKHGASTSVMLRIGQELLWSVLSLFCLKQLLPTEALRPAEETRWTFRNLPGSVESGSGLLGGLGSQEAPPRGSSLSMNFRDRRGRQAGMGGRGHPRGRWAGVQPRRQEGGSATG